MRTLQISKFSPLTLKELNLLTSEIRETIAFEYKAVAAKSFSAADFWNIRRRSRSASRTRNFIKL